MSRDYHAGAITCGKTFNLQFNEFKCVYYQAVENVFNVTTIAKQVFRHGDRTPDVYPVIYPNDPYINETYYPYGVGQLTKVLYISL